MARMHDDEVETDAALVTRLIAGQFPEWGGSPVAPVDSYGADNAIYRLGERLSVRLPRIRWAVAPLQREFAWLPRIAPALPFEVPVPVALGAPAEGFAWPWTVCRWLEGEHPTAAEPAVTADASVTDVSVTDVPAGETDDLPLARDLAVFVRAMRALDPADAPATAWPRPLHDEDAFARASLARVPAIGGADAAGTVSRATTVWAAAMRAPRYDGPPVWVHGDLAPANLLVRDGRLSGVLDFGAMGVGDPASEHRVAWNLLSPTARELYRDEVGADDATWARARGWALLQALAQVSYFGDRNPRLTAVAHRVIATLGAELDAADVAEPAESAAAEPAEANAAGATADPRTPRPRVSFATRPRAPRTTRR